MQPERRRMSRDEQRRQTVERLLDSAEALFREQGIADTSIEDITENAGYSRGAFYSNFDDKDALVVRLLERQQDATVEETNIIAEAATDPERLMDGLLDWSRDAGGTHTKLDFEYVLYASRSGAGRPKMKELSDRLLAQLQHLVEMHHAMLDVDMPIAPTEAAKIMLGLDQGFALLRLVDPDTYSQAIWADTIGFLNEAVLALAEKRQRGADST